MNIGVLDFCRVCVGQQSDDPLWATFELARHAEALGYSRYWLTEHHTADVAHACPEVLLPILAGCTETMQVGIAGVLLRYQSALRVANIARCLSAVFPRRVELGIARGYVEPSIADRLDAGWRGEGLYESRVDELLACLQGRAGIAVQPAGVAPPQTWVLGSRGGSVELAATRGLAFCVGLFLSGDERATVAAIEEYRQRFVPGMYTYPRWALAVAGVCADDGKSARNLAERWGPGAKANVVGGSSECADSLERLASLHATEEIVFLDMCPDNESRVASYSLLAEAVGLKKTPAPATPGEGDQCV